MTATSAIQSRSSSFKEWGFQFVISFCFAASLFALFTNFVPFIQLGWMGELGKKSRYFRITMLAACFLSVMLVLLRWKLRSSFEKSLPVLIWRKVSSWPILLTATFFFVAYFALMTLVGFERHLALQTRAFDLGIFAQAVWNTTQGHFLFSSIKENICLLGDHVSPILLLAAPFYHIWPDPRTLVWLQAFAVAASFFPLALIAEKKLQNRTVTLLLLLAYFFFRPLRNALHEDFHPEVISEHFIWWAFLFLEEKKIKTFLFFLVLVAAGKENFLGITFMMGFYAFAWKKMKGLGASVMILSVLILIFEMKWLIPHLTGQQSFYLANYHPALTNPISEMLSRLFSLESLEYFFTIYLPFIYLPLFHIPTLFLTFPILFQNLLSSSGGMRSFNYHYMTGMIPFLFISTIYALHSLRIKSIRVGRAIHWVAAMVLLVCVLRSGPAEYYFFWHINSSRTPHKEMIRSQLQTIPRNAVVLTHNNLIPQVLNRKHVYQFDYSPTSTKADFAKKYHADYVVFESTFWEPNTQSLDNALTDLMARGYVVEFSKDGFFILKNSSKEFLL